LKALQICRWIGSSGPFHAGGSTGLSLAQINQLDREEAATKAEDEVQKRRQAYDGAIAKLAGKGGDCCQ
jgi:hypothetical protein